MVFYRHQYLKSKTLVYNELVRIIGRNLTDRIRGLFVTPFKVFMNREALNDLREVLTYYEHSSIKDYTAKQLINEYLFSLVFPPKKRLETLSFQYKFLHKRLTSQQRSMMIERGALCWRKDFEDCSHSIVMKIPQKYECEGCLSLSYAVDDKEIYLIAFTICPGSDFGFNDQFVILVSRIQGTKGRHEDISKAAKQLIDIFPSSALMSALEGLCLTLDINKVIGISAKNQVSFIDKDHRPAISQYDDFWKTFEADTLNVSGDYLITVPFGFKSLEHIRSKFRKRTLAKRSEKSSISKITQTNCTILFSSPSLGTSIAQTVAA